MPEENQENKETADRDELVARLQAELKKERDDKTKAEATLKDLRTKFDKRLEKTDDDIATQIGQVNSQWEKKLGGVVQERDALRQRNRQLGIVERGTRAIGTHKGISPVLLPYLQQVADVDDAGRVFVKGEDGKPLLKKNFTSLEDYMPIEDFVGRLKDDPVWAVAFESNGARGSNSQQTTTTRNDDLPMGRKTADGGVIFD